MFNLLFKFLKGYVIISLYGRNTERFLNICTRRGIGVHDIERSDDGAVIARVKRRDFRLLRPIAYKTRVKVHILKKKGFTEARKRYGRRYGLMAGIILCMLFMLAAPRFVWTVEIEGNEEVPDETIKAALDEAGIYRGALKGKIPDGFTVKNIILKSDPRIMWAWAYIKGTSVTVQISENELPPVLVDRRSPCSICASCDAYIKSVRTLNGERMAGAGDVVRAGDVLVSGRMPVFKDGYPEKYMYVHARAEVEAYTLRTESGIYKLEREIRTPTGRTESKAYIELFGRRLPLYRKEECSYECFDTEEFCRSLPFIIVGGRTYREVISETEPMGLEGAVGIAKEELEEKIAKKLCKNAVMLDEEVDHEYVSENEIRVRLTMSCIEDIGTEMPIDTFETEETNIDKQEN